MAKTKKDKKLLHLFGDYYCTVDELNITVMKKKLIEKEWATTYGQEKMKVIGYCGWRGLSHLLKRHIASDVFEDFENSMELVEYIQKYEDRMKDIFKEMEELRLKR